jgi:3-deoxy-D-manno-octulosonate 8-phosphate phosphatase (KDO 8-P phosphatase)
MLKKKERFFPTNFILDLDGVFTDGKFYYTNDGKYMKVFGADDHDCLSALSKLLAINVITADSKGFEISQKRIQQDMGFQIDLVSATERASWISSRFNIDKTIYMGDGVLDYLVFSKVFYAIAPANALQVTKNKADFVTKNSGGERAVAEACLHIVNKFFKGFQAASGVNLNELKQILRMQ